VINEAETDLDDAGRVVRQGTPVTGEVAEYGNDGALLSVETYRDGIHDGVSRIYYADGTLKSERWYEFGVSVGTARWWYSNRQLKEEITYDGQGSVVNHQTWNDDGTIQGSN
jgi:antitoxin component YwqK of YwqJK toxin-antitoxin module